MDNYFYNMIPKEELEKLPYLPTLVDLLEKTKRDYADRPAVSDMVNTYTYAEFYERIGKRRALINSLNLPKGSNIAVFDRNTVDAMELFFAITTAGYTVMMLPAQLPEPAIIGSTMKFNIKAMFVRDEFKPLTAKLQIPVLPASEMGETFAPCADVKKDDVACIYFTGGTTGAPKGVVLSHGAMMRGSFSGIFMPDSVLRPHRYIAMLPMSHIFGIVRGFLSCIYTGALIYSCEDIKAMIGKIPQIKPTCLVVVPGMAEILLGLVKMYGVGFLGGELHTLICGAANVPPKLIALFQQFGISLLGGYGLTESANLVSGNANVVEKPESVGKPYPGQELKLVNGELWVKGENIMQGYYNDPQATAEVMEGGWLKTGDLARFDEDGFLYITGRIKNIILLKNGENVSPEEIEEHFYMDGRVRDCLVKEVEMNGEMVIGIEILPRMDSFENPDPANVHAELQKLVDEVNAKMPSFMHISTMKVRTEDFKRTGAMKVDRKNN